MKFWECVAVLIAVESGHYRRSYPLFESEARHSLRLCQARRDEIDEELGIAGDIILSEGLELLKTDRRKFMRETAIALQERYSRN
jgi:hypothetical protein